MTNYEKIKSMTLEEMAESTNPFFACPYGFSYGDCKDGDCIINRQKAEIEKLKGSTIVSNIIESQRIKREAKAEAYKEFAERLKSYLLLNKKGEMSVICFENVDTLLKEMVGDEE